MKKLVKQAQIAAKRLAQGKSAQAAALPPAGGKPKGDAKGGSKGESGTPAAVLKPAAGTVAGVEEQAIVADLLAAIGGPRVATVAALVVLLILLRRRRR